MPVRSRRGPQGFAGHPVWDDLRPRLPTAGQKVDSVPRQPPLVRVGLLPQYVETFILYYQQYESEALLITALNMLFQQEAFLESV